MPEMREITKINGIAVWSDKKGITIIFGTRVDFADGSWCDVGTGEIFHAEGEPGTILIVYPDSSEPDTDVDNGESTT